MSEELLNCPFCDSNTITVTHIHNVRWGCYCDDCDTQQDPNAATYEEAIKAWNTRADTVTDKERAEALAALVKLSGIAFTNTSEGDHSIDENITLTETIGKVLSRTQVDINSLHKINTKEHYTDMFIHDSAIDEMKKLMRGN